ncbi:MAG: diguanylate cyclase protein, partial [Solirubrobacterales bacterium]|nr:diguanylate cyclase protein [Solirubrobacterales bacterium]
GSTVNRSSAGRGGSSGRTGSSTGSGSNGGGSGSSSPSGSNLSNAGSGGGTPTAAPTTPTTPAPTPAGKAPSTPAKPPQHPTQQHRAPSARRTATTRPASTPPAATTPSPTPATFAAPTFLPTTAPAGTPAATRHPAPAEGQGHGGASGIGSAPATLARDINKIVRVVPVWAWIMLGVLAAFGFFSATLAAAFARRARYADALVGRIRTAAITDPLTGLLNRRGFAEALEHEIARARRFEHPLAVAFLDVRGLKAVNDDFGHQAGDDLLKAVGALLHRTSRQADIVARVGGDECAVALIEQDRAGAVAFARRIAAEVPHTRAELGVLADWDLTVGVAVFPEDGDNGEELLAAADRRLYMRRGIALQPARH